MILKNYIQNKIFEWQWLKSKPCAACKSHLLYDVKIPNIKHSQSFENKTVGLCVSCKEDAEKLYDKITDIRFVLFSDFVKEGDE